MEMSKNQLESKPVSVLQGDGICISRILARESSVGQSSRIFYRRAEGVPFKWEKQPGKPMYPQEEDSAIFPLSPPPMVQSLGLPLPNVDHDHEQPKGLALKIWSLRKKIKEGINENIVKNFEIHGSKRRGKSQGSSSRIEDSSLSSCSSYSSMLSFSSNSRVLDSSRLPVESIDGAFCCSPWNLSAILDEGNIKIYYCRDHKTAFAVEEDGSFLSRILSGISPAEQFSGSLHSGMTPAGVPFEWEMLPGTPKNLPEDELIPPPSPPPAVLSSALPLPKIHDQGEKPKKPSWKKSWFWIRQHNKVKKSEKVQHEISFRRDQNMVLCGSDEELDASFFKSGFVKSASSVTPFSKDTWRNMKMKRGLKGGYFSCGPWGTRDILGFARRKLKPIKF